ncbi:MAG: alkyl sulfatase C-terminal domain-containing protein, partial [Candidatus Binatales bacterium]
NGDKAAGKTIVLNWRFTDTKQDYVLNLENSALTCVPDMQADNADATLTLTRATLDEISLRKTTFEAALQSAQIAVTGKGEKLAELLEMLDTFPIRFPVVEPRPPR